MASTIDAIGEDLLQNIVTRLPATSFASAACVNHSWNIVCDRVLSRPKLASACSFNPSLHVAVEEVVNKVLSEPIRPHFAIVSVGGSYNPDSDEDDDEVLEEVLEQTLHLITAALGTHVQVIANHPRGIIGRDAVSDEFKEIEFISGAKKDSVLLIVGFLPGLKVKTIPLVWEFGEPDDAVMIDDFITDIREFSTSVSGCNSPTAIIMFTDLFACAVAVMETMDYAMSAETVIVGDTLSRFRYTNYAEHETAAAVALVFAADSNKPPGIGETQFHVVLSSGLSPVGPTYKTTSVIEHVDSSTWLAARSEGSHENINSGTILNQVFDEIEDRMQDLKLCIGVTKERKYSISQQKVGCMWSLSFHAAYGNYREYLFVYGNGIKNGDAFRFYHSDTATALSSAAAVSSYLRSFNQGSNSTTGGDKWELFGGLIFASPDESFYGQPNVTSSPFLDNLPGATLGGIFCSSVIGRSVLTPNIKGFQEQKLVRCCVHAYCTVYLIMSYHKIH